MGELGGGVTFGFSGLTRNTTSSAQNATITNDGGAVNDAPGAVTNFYGASTAASAIILNNAGTASGASGGNTLFGDDTGGTSTAGSATITNNGATVSGGGGGSTAFGEAATAGSATITTSGGSNGGGGGSTYFSNSADGGTAHAITNGNGIFDISGLTGGGMKIGSIAGSGTYFLGGNTLTVGGNGTSTTVSGVIADGGQDGGTGGSLVVTNAVALTLTGQNIYTGSTSILNGATINANVTGALPATAADGGAGTLRTAVLMDQSGTGGSVLSLGANQAIASLTGATSSGVKLNGNILTIGNKLGGASTTFAGIISDGTGTSGTGGLTKDGSSTLLLSGASTYTGVTTLNGGTLLVNGSLAAASTVNVNSDATLGGTGTVSGTVNVFSGGILNPGGASAPGTLTLGNLVLNGGANSNFRLAKTGVSGGGVNDLAKLSGNLTTGGSVNVTQLSGFSVGSYTLITYAGALTDNGFEKCVVNEVSRDLPLRSPAAADRWC